MEDIRTTTFDPASKVFLSLHFLNKLPIFSSIVIRSQSSRVIPRARGKLRLQMTPDPPRPHRNVKPPLLRKSPSSSPLFSSKIHATSTAKNTVFLMRQSNPLRSDRCSDYLSSFSRMKDLHRRGHVSSVQFFKSTTPAAVTRTIEDAFSTLPDIVSGRVSMLLWRLLCIQSNDRGSRPTLLPFLRGVGGSITVQDLEW